MSDLERAAQRLAKGDDSAFDEIVEATNAKLVRVAARVLGSVADAEDVVQEAYVKVYSALTDGSFDGRSKVETWLYRVVVNASIDAKRSRMRKREDELSDSPEIGGGWTGQASAETTLALKEIASMLDELPEEQRGAMVLKSFEGMSSAEIAEVLEISEGAVEQRLVRARAALRGKGKDHD